MVQVRDHHSLHDDGDVCIDQWVTSLLGKVAEGRFSRETLVAACELALKAESSNNHVTDQVWASTVSSFRTGQEMAEILTELHLYDQDSLVASILYRVVRESRLDIESVQEQFGESVTTLIEGVRKMAVISTLRADGDGDVFGHVAAQQATKVRGMLVSIIDDVRVALIKIAERTCAIRALKTASKEKRLRVAREVFDVYAPLAHRLGIGQLKWELEDLAFRYLETDEYMRIAKLLNERRMDRQQYIKELTRILEMELSTADLKGEIAGRAKHIYSIWRKMHLKDIGFAQIYDIRAVRVLVPTIADCYTLLGIVHSHWRNIPNEFDDYIATPKENGYRSLHTAVIGPHRKVLEIQIRTYAMHEDAELGVCSHWRYKGTDAKSTVNSYEDKISWLRQVLEWHEEIEGEHVKGLLSLDNGTDRIYVFTPEGHVVDLAVGSTPLDFAYRVHTSIGHRCRGAKINGKIVPLNTALQTSDQVIILTGKQESPSRDWLSSALGYIYTARARAKVQQWFRKQNMEQNIHAGKSILEREFRQLNIKDVDLDALSIKYNKHGADGLYSAIGAGDIRVDQVVNATLAQQDMAMKPGRLSYISQPKASRYADSDIYIYGVGNLLTRIAQCCNPVPGDEISGYITNGRGVSVHRKDCGNLLRLQTIEPDRVLEVCWGSEPKHVYPVKIMLDSYDRSGLLRDVSTVLDKSGLNILAVTSSSDQTNEGVSVGMEVIVEVPSIEELSTVMTRLRKIPNMTKVQRVDES
ncbi:MAG: GTP pyrophosphokinase [Porticoccus sp.]|jgi:GTP pyrophosphokinase